MVKKAGLQIGSREIARRSSLKFSREEQTWIVSKSPDVEEGIADRHVHIGQTSGRASNCHLAVTSSLNQSLKNQNLCRFPSIEVFCKSSSGDRNYAPLTTLHRLVEDETKGRDR